MAKNAAQPRGVSYYDYNRTIIVYHGTTVDVAARLVAGEPFAASENDDDWFGRGIYFWEYAPKQAWWWATKYKKKNNPAVVGAIIRLGECCGLATIPWPHPQKMESSEGRGPEKWESAQEAGLRHFQLVLRPV